MALNLDAETELSDDSCPTDTAAIKPPPLPTPSSEEIAKLFPHFQILACLGRGGMGAVYKARQPKLDRFVALKILLPERYGGGQFAERFAREARALARLNHPDIVAVHDFGEAGGYPYLVMEYVDGLSLRQLLQRGQLAPEEALVIVPKICEALQFAHQQGVVHRDIKPENILLDKQGRVKIADFGIAKILVPGAQDLTLTGGKDVVGTPHYMAPEQIEHPARVDHRADIFSLGVVFYEMLTGELPLGKFQPPSRKVLVDVRLDEVVLHALEKEPERRYQHAIEVKTAVETIAAARHADRLGPVPNAPVTLKRWCDCWPWDAGWLALYLIAPAVVASILVSLLIPYLGLRALWFLTLELVGIGFAINYGLVGLKLRRVKASLPRPTGEVAEALMFRRPFESPGLAVLHSDRLELIPIAGAPITVILRDIATVSEVRWFNGTRLWWKRGFVLDLAGGQRVGVAVPEPFRRRWRAHLSGGSLPELPVDSGQAKDPTDNREAKGSVPLWNLFHVSAVVDLLLGPSGKNRSTATRRPRRWATVTMLGLAVFLAVWFQQDTARHSIAPGTAAPLDNLVFPSDAGIVDVTQPPYHAKTDGKTDATAAIQQALADYRGKHAIIYLPNGSYLVSDTLRWGQGQGSGSLCKFTTLQGQSRNRTIIKLKDGCAGFNDPKAPRSVIWTGPKGAECYRNSIRNLTVDTGTNNPGAIGLQFNANQGCLRDVIIQTGDGRGVTGLDMAFADDIGPLFVKNLTVRGFSVGIHTKEVLNSQTFEHISLQDQSYVGFLNEGQTVSIRGFTSTGSVPAFRNEGQVGLALIVDARLNGRTGAEAHAAILNRSSLFARNVTVEGFGLAIAHTGIGSINVAGPFVVEWVSRRLPGSAPSLNLPVKETPEVPWDDPAEWANVMAFGASPNAGSDDSAAIQRAIDSGKRTVYLPLGEYTLRQPIQLRGKVRRLIGCEAFLHVDMPDEAGPVFVLTAGEAAVVVVERILADFKNVNARQLFIDNRSSRTLVLRDFGGGTSEFTGAGEVFLENVDGRMIFHGQRVWARQFSQRTWEELPIDQRFHVRNDGGQLWILGEKTIGPGTVVATTRGGRSELMGGLLYSSAAATDQPDPAFVVEAGALSVSIHEVSHSNSKYPILVRRVAVDGFADLLIPDYARGGINASLIPLFTTE
jgi:tRNA A-37 threonylcarbamoyl transferase component Bud32